MGGDLITGSRSKGDASVGAEGTDSSQELRGGITNKVYGAPGRFSGLVLWSRD